MIALPSLLGWYRTTWPQSGSPPGQVNVREHCSMSESKEAQRGSSRRSILRGGAALTGAAVAAGGLHVERAFAQQEGGRISQILDRGKVMVGTGSTNPPWHFEDEAGQLIGFDIEMAKILAGGLFGLNHDQILAGESLNNIEFVVHEADARIPDLLTDKVDINFQFMTVTPARALQVDVTIPYYREGVTLILPADSPFNSLSEMQDQGLTIAILANVTAEDMIRRGVADANVEQYDSVASSLEALDSGRADATGIDLSTGAWLVAQNPDMYKVIQEGWDAQSYSASVKKGEQEWLNFVNVVLREAMLGLDFPLYAQAFRTFFSTEVPKPATGFPGEMR
jgi:polar amino acid transport system substrate-binding protein